MPPSVLRDVEDEVNEVLIDDLAVRAYVMPHDEARAMGAIALFGEKYGDEVRVVEVGDYSRELCGGTHVANSGQLGLIKVLGESSIGSGVRRVEALVGIDAFRFLARESVLVSQLTEQLKARPEELPERVAGLVTRLRDAERELERLRSGRCWRRGRPGGRRRGRRRGGLRRASGAGRHPADGIRKLALDVRGRLPRTARRGALAGVPADRPVSWSRSTRRPAGAAWPPGPWSGRPPGRSAAAAAARTTSPRAAARPLETGRAGDRRCFRRGSCGCEGRREGWRTVRPCCSYPVKPTDRCVRSLPLRTGVRLGVDLGSARIGVARSDPDGLLASPLTTVPRGRGDIDSLVSLALTHQAIEIIVGLPTSLSGRAGAAAAEARDFATALASRLNPLPVRLVDERFTTVLAHDALRQGGKGPAPGGQSWTRPRPRCCCRGRWTPSGPPASRPGSQSPHLGRAGEPPLAAGDTGRAGLGAGELPAAG